MYEALGLEVVHFGRVTLLNSDSSVPDFNMIFDMGNHGEHHHENLKNTLLYARTKNNPFLLIRQEDQDHSTLQVLNELKIDKIDQEITSMLHSHDKPHVNDKKSYKVRKVCTEEMMEISCLILSEAFEVSLSNIKKVFFSQYFLNECTIHPFFITYNSINKAVAASMLYLPHNKYVGAGHYCWSTRPQYRNKGAMYFLVGEMINIVQNKGYSKSVAQCLSTSTRLAQATGFSINGRLNFFLV